MHNYQEQLRIGNQSPQPYSTQWLSAGLLSQFQNCVVLQWAVGVWEWKTGLFHTYLSSLPEAGSQHESISASLLEWVC